MKTKSDMTSFLQLARPLRLPLDARHHSVRFNPDYVAFETPSRASNNLTVDFQGLFSLLTWLKVNDFNDHISFATKKSVRRPGGVLRLLGTSCKITLRDGAQDGAPIDVDCVLPFISRLESHITHLKQLLQSDLDNDSFPTPEPSNTRRLHDDIVLYRYRQNFDESQGRFVSPWRVRRVTWGELDWKNTSQSIHGSSTPVLASNENPSDSDQTFSVQWCRSTPLPSSQWTEDATYMGSQVIGDITAFFPTVLFFGPSTLAEVDALISKHCF